MYPKATYDIGDPDSLELSRTVFVQWIMEYSGKMKSRNCKSAAEITDLALKTQILTHLTVDLQLKRPQRGENRLLTCRFAVGAPTSYFSSPPTTPLPIRIRLIWIIMEITSGFVPPSAQLKRHRHKTPFSLYAEEGFLTFFFCMKKSKYGIVSYRLRCRKI